MNLFNVLVYSEDHRHGACPYSERNILAESGSHATRIVMDGLERFPWKRIDAVESGRNLSSPYRPPEKMRHL